DRGLRRPLERGGGDHAVGGGFPQRQKPLLDFLRGPVHALLLRCSVSLVFTRGGSRAVSAAPSLLPRSWYAPISMPCQFHSPASRLLRVSTGSTPHGARNDPMNSSRASATASMMARLKSSRPTASSSSISTLSTPTPTARPPSTP